MGSANETRSAAAQGRELELLRWVAEAGSVSVGEATEAFGAARGLARTTVQTMLERLRAKGRLERRRQDGVYRYASKLAAPELLKGLVRSFVQGPLGGSVSPVTAYLAERRSLDEEEIAELEQLVTRLRSRKETRR